MRMRSVMLVSIVTVGCSWIVVSSAAALEVGPVSVPVTLPTVAPTAGPVVVVEAPAVAPQLGITASVSPATGVAVDVTTPSGVGPIPLAGGSHSVHVAVGADGGSVAVGPTGAAPGAPPARTSAPRSVHGSTPAAASGAASDSSQRAPSPRASAPDHAAPVTSVVASNANSHVVANDDTADVVNASLRHSAPGGVWDFWRGGASARLLWLALLMIALAANWVVVGFIRDALRRSRVVNPV